MSEAKRIYKRTFDGFAPANDDAAEFFGRVKLGQLVTMDCKQSRNLKFHRLFFAILRLIGDNSNPHISEAAALLCAKAAAGHGEWLDTGRRELLFRRASVLPAWTRRRLKNL